MPKNALFSITVIIDGRLTQIICLMASRYIIISDDFITTMIM